ncbi:hypothetical protein [Parasedimentitalea psychrophila]|uniref:Uncharacterized protein n=1 Tax=Parasedimentitalea psychrophila TaxID=2997337 RepID=A0A9Y2P5R6_9RHOB|nr:hypothetical protein [Parasedimentitalea psychrophila]WIY24243.1 hypothetical protein QPJ95_16795 [Parasedimentitalea psychrophila]
MQTAKLKTDVAAFVGDCTGDNGKDDHAMTDAAAIGDYGCETLSRAHSVASMSLFSGRAAMNRCVACMTPVWQFRVQAYLRAGSGVDDIALFLLRPLVGGRYEAALLRADGTFAVWWPV